MTKKTKIIIAVLMVVALAVSFIGGTTYAKYLTEVTGHSNAKIAKWSFKVNGESAQMQTINLIQTCTEESLTNGKIAPGTSGSFDLIMDGQGADVGINYFVNCINEENKPQNIEFIYNGKTYQYMADVCRAMTGTINANDDNKIKIHTVEWRWLYETEPSASNDQVDTTDGTFLSDYSFNINVTGNQMMPTQ